MSIVVGYLPTPAGRAALRAGVEEARLRSVPLLVVQGQEMKRFGRGAAHPEDALIAIQQDLKTLDGAGVKYRVEEMSPEADPADAILEAASREQARMIVIGTRKRTPVGKLIMAPTVQRILMEAPCPVLSVKADYAGL